ncbi:hypothetical protein [Alteromonas lipolytica]|uniref:PEP-CTERM protein-sorting domain-containing protein n=1 Tax=Alteromonas lipolytica TaxID=1856405 RepID=A0A1E8FG88_9ALTE|nr:hypothetical protein [Alteromonas lipolytica]OFI34919.1 hypothetical protein BFC17_15245 [Alteromonas lipolytica]GGF55107.1 hypothetical protein GCM10011338_04170 [Alteromonas lipolytica]
MFKSFLKISAFILLSLALRGQANAVIISFDDIVDDFRTQNLPSYTESGFTLDVSCQNCVNVFSTSEEIVFSGYGTQPFAAAGWGASNRFMETWNTAAIFTLSQSNGEAFDFTSMNIGWFNHPTAPASWEVRVFDENGVQTGSSVDYVGSGLFNFNYSGIYSLELQNNGGFSSFDNLNVTAVKTSTPATLGLFGLSLMCMAYAGRRVKR